MSSPSYRDITLNGLWKNNPALVQLLGLCPLLGVSNSTVNALGLALASAVVLICSNTAVSLVRGVVNTAVRLPAFVMIIAALTTCIELLMQAYTYELYQIFDQLLGSRCRRDHCPGLGSQPQSELQLFPRFGVPPRSQLVTPGSFTLQPSQPLRLVSTEN
jgi:hypothetical protein